MSNESQFIGGLIVKPPHEKAPDYVKAKLSIKREELAEWLGQQDGDWINAEVKESKGGKWYVAVDSWKPEGGKPQQRDSRPAPQRQAPAQDFADDDIPW